MNISLAKTQYRLNNQFNQIDDSLLQASTIGNLVPWNAYKNVKRPNQPIPDAEIEKLVGYVMGASHVKALPFFVMAGAILLCLLLILLPDVLNFEIIPEWRRVYDYIIVGIFVVAFIAMILLASWTSTPEITIHRKAKLDYCLSQSASKDVLKQYFQAENIYTHEKLKFQKDSTEFLNFLKYQLNTHKSKKFNKLSQTRRTYEEEVLSFDGKLSCGAHFQYHDFRYGHYGEYPKHYAIKTFSFTLPESVDTFIIDLQVSAEVGNVLNTFKNPNAMKFAYNVLGLSDDIRYLYADFSPYMRFPANEPNIDFDMIHLFVREIRMRDFHKMRATQDHIEIVNAPVNHKSNLLCDIQNGYGIPNARFQDCLDQIRTMCACRCSVIGHDRNLIFVFFDPNYLFLSDLGLDCQASASVTKMQRRWSAQATWVHQIFEPLYKNGIII